MRARLGQVLDALAMGPPAPAGAPAHHSGVSRPARSGSRPARPQSTEEGESSTLDAQWPQIREVLRRSSILVTASLGPDGYPHMTPTRIGPQWHLGLPHHRQNSNLDRQRTVTDLLGSTT